MSAIYITPAVYADIRAAIQIDLGVEDIPDAIIAMQQFSGAAERDVITLTALAVPTPPGRGTDEYVILVSAAVQFCAARLLSTLPQLSHERYVDYDYARVPMDITKRVNDLVQRGMRAVAQALGIDLVSLLKPATMALADGGRGNTQFSGWTWHSGAVFMGPY